MTKVVVTNRLTHGGETFKSGDVVEMSIGEALDLESLGKATIRAEKKAAVTAPKEGKNNG